MASCWLGYLSLALLALARAGIIRKQGLKEYLVKRLGLSERPSEPKARIFEYLFRGTNTSMRVAPIPLLPDFTR